MTMENVQENVAVGKPYAILAVRLESSGWENRSYDHLGVDGAVPLGADFMPHTGRSGGAYSRQLGTVTPIKWTLNGKTYSEAELGFVQWIYGAAVFYCAIAPDGTIFYSKMWVATGAWDAHGAIGYMAVSAVLNYFTAGISGVAMSAFDAQDSSDWGKVAGKAVKAYYGADDGGATDAVSNVSTAAETAETGASMFEDIDVVDSYGDSFDWGGYNFSSGESDIAFSDIQTVDYGFGGGEDFGFDWSGVDPGTALDPRLADIEGYTESVGLNWTPEVVSNDFGTTWDWQFAKDAAQTAVDGVKLATQAVGVVSAVKAATGGNGTQGKPATTGATGAKASASSSTDLLASLGSLYRQVQGAVAGVSGQKTDQVKTTHTGQLAPNGQRANMGTTGFSSNHLMIAGAGLLIVALYLHKKG